MRIVQLITRSDNIGGAQIHVRDLAHRLQECGHEVTVVVGGNGPYVEALLYAGIDVIPLKHLVRQIHPYHDWRALQEVKALLRTLRPDLLATHSSKAGWLGRIAAHSLRLPVVSTAHGWSFAAGVPPLKRHMYRLAERMTAGLCKKMIAVSQADCDLAVQGKVLPPDKMVVVHNGIPDVRHPHHYAEPARQPARVLMVSRFEAPKEQAQLLRVMARIRTLPWELELVGDGPMRAECERFAEQLGITASVRFLGARDDVAERLSKAQIFVLLSRWEGFPLCVLEAMRAGLPVIASDVGGIREAIVHGNSGYLIPHGDEDFLQKKIEMLLADPSLRLYLGQNARQKYRKQFTLPVMVERTLGVYEEVLLQPQLQAIGD